MIQTESNIPEKERNSYWDGSPASLKKWTSRGLFALLILYYGGGVALHLRAGTAPNLFTFVFALLPFTWPLGLCSFVELNLYFTPLVLTSFAALGWSVVRIAGAETRRAFVLAASVLLILFLTAIGGCVVHANSVSGWSP